MKTKILGNLTEETHKAVLLIKIDKGFKSIDTTLKFLLEVYKKYLIKLEMENDEHINNSNIEEKENNELNILNSEEVSV